MGRSRKDPYSPTEEISAVRRGRGEKIVSDSDNSINVLGHPKGVRGLTFYFLCGGGMDVFWNDPIQIFDAIPQFGEFCNKTLA